MSDQLPSDRFKTEMPEIPGVSEPAPRPAPASPAAKLMIALLLLLFVAFQGVRWALRPKPAETRPYDQQPQIDVPSPALDPNPLIPHATPANPGIADISEMSTPWSSKAFLIANRLSGENVPALLIRLPTGSPSKPSGYWGFATNSAYGDCKLEFISDLGKLKNEYGFRDPKHPMVGNPCTQTLYDPLKLIKLPTDVWVRGAIAQGSDLRPPMGVEIRVEGKTIEAVRTE